MPTPHISAPDGAFAEAMLLPGDPLRAQHIADTFFDDPVQVTDVRNMFGFTGTYQGMPVSVMGTGMGIPSASIYITELIRSYGVQRLVRVGSAGAIAPDLALRDTVLAIGACTDSATNRTRYNGWDFAPTADYRLLAAAVASASSHGIDARVGNVHSSDLFYNPREDALAAFERMGVLAVEMEAAALYAIAAEEGARALTVVTISDHIVRGEQTTSAERQETFQDMVKVSLDALVADHAHSD